MCALKMKLNHMNVIYGPIGTENTKTKTIFFPRILLFTIPFVGLMFLLAYSTGVFVFAYYAINQCDPLESNQANNPNEVRLYLVFFKLKHM